MSVGIWGASASSYDSSSRTEQSSSASEVQRQSEAQQSQKAEQPKETSATINENDRAELSEAAKSVAANSAEGENGQSRSLGEKILGKAGDIANTVLKTISGLINGESGGKIENIDEGKATDGIKDPATADMLKEVPGYEERLNETYKNAVPEVKKMYEKYEGKIKLSDADLMTGNELNKFNFDFAETVSKKINEAQKGKQANQGNQTKQANQGNQTNQANQGNQTNQANQGNQTNQGGLSGIGMGIGSLLGDPEAAERFNIANLLYEAQKPINAGDGIEAFTKKFQAINALTSKLTEAYGDDINGLKAAVIDNIASTGYNTDKIASAKSVDEIANALSSLSAEGAYYTGGSKSIYIDAPSDMNESDPPGRTYFHEVGHLMDDAAYTKDDNTPHPNRWMMSDNPEFRDAIKDDFKKYVDKYKNEHKDEISRITKCCEGNDVTASEKMSDKDKRINDYIKNLDPKIREKYSTEDLVAYRLISEMMRENEPKEENGGKTNMQLYQTASDIFGGLTDRICEGYWGHPNEYWKSSESAITSETFAHMFQTSMTNDEELQKLKEIFPTAYEKFMEMVKQAS